jgi:poly-gamma-glutamate capsule biosynthesis protein CapA/YwtB (metallophosphatase superfamily)
MNLPPHEARRRDPAEQIPAEPLAATIADGFRLAAGGDLIGPGRPQLALADPGLAAVAELFRHADAGLANLEEAVFDLATFPAIRAAENGGGYPLAAASTAADLRGLGVTMVSRANNHATDFGAEGMLETSRVLDAAGLVHAGSGRSRAQARAGACLETPKGTIALVSVAATFTPMSVAGPPSADTAGRPGISVVRATPVNVVTADAMRVLHGIARPQGLTGNLDNRAFGDENDLTIGSERFRVGSEPGLEYEVNAHDHFELLRAVRSAKQVADLVVLAIHAHETKSGNGDDRRPADFLVSLSHDAIDTGADLVVFTGPRTPRGIELHGGKPILYSLGSLFLELGGGLGPEPDTARAFGIDPEALTGSEFVAQRFTLTDDWYTGAVAVTEFRGGEPAELRIHPLALTRSDEYRLHGHPRLATGDAARRILGAIAADSEPFGTELVVEGEVGIVRIGGS